MHDLELFRNAYETGAVDDHGGLSQPSPELSMLRCTLARLSGLLEREQTMQR